MAPRLFLTGVPAVGKTSIAGSPRLPHERVATAEFGRYMLDAGLRRGEIDSLEQLKAASPALRARLQSDAVERINDESSTMPLIIDGHLIVATRVGFVPGIPPEQIDALQLSAIVIIRATSADILLRRNARPEKYSSSAMNNGDSIDLHDELTRAAALFYSLSKAVPISVVWNHQEKLDGAINDFMRVGCETIRELCE